MPSSPLTNPSAPEIHCFTLGPYETNCYIVVPPRGAESTAERACWIVDASFEPSPIVDFVRQHGLIPQSLILTHAHIDHIAGVAEVVSAFSPHGRGGGAAGGAGGKPLPVWIHEAEKDWLSDPMLNLSALSGMSVTAPGPDRLLKDNDKLELGGTSWTVFHTPGHSPGGITLYHADSGTAMVGDTLFAGSVGRTDFPGCSQKALFEAIRTKLYTLPEATKAYPGHGPATTIGRERKHNPFVKA